MAPSLQIPVSAKLDQFKSDMDETSSRADKAASAIVQKFEAINPNAKAMIENFRDAAEGPAKDAGSALGLIIAGALAAAAAGITTGLKSAIDSLAKLGDRGEDLRLPVNMLQALSVAATAARVPAEKLNSALDKFTEKSKEEGDDLDKLNKALTNIGPGFAKAFKDAPTQAERLKVISDALHATTDEVKKAQLGLQAFGTDNERLLSIFDKGRDGIAGYIDQIKRLGLEVNETFVRQAQEAKSQIALFTRVLTDEFSTGVASLIPLFVSLLPYIERLGAVVRDTMGAFASSDAAKPIGTLTAEVETLTAEIDRVQARRDRLADEKPGVVVTVRDKLRQIIGDVSGADLSENLDDLDKQIEKVKARRDTIIDLLRDRSRPQSNTPASNAPAFRPRPSLGKDDSDETIDAFDREIDRLKRATALTEADAAAVAKTTVEHATYRAELQLLQAAQKVNDDITTDQITKYAQLRVSMSSLQALQAAGIKLTDDQSTAFAEATRRATAAATALNSARLSFQGINDAVRFGGNEFVNFVDRATQKGAQFGQIMADVFRAVAKQMLLAAVTGEGAFAKLFGLSSQNGGVGGLGGLIAGLFKGGGGGSIGASTASTGINAGFAIGGAASGGTIPPGGLAIVSEHSAGGGRLVRAPRNEPLMVTPNDVASPGGGSTVVQISFGDIDARGAAAGVGNEIVDQLRRQIPAIAVAAVRDATRRRAL